MKVKEVLLGVIIGVVLLMFLVFGTKLIYEKPQYEDYCDSGNRYLTLDKLNDSQVQAQNEFFRACQDNYDEANERYSKKMFVLSLILGIAIIVLSTIFIDLMTVSGGLMFGSLMFIIYGTGSYWRYMNDWTRFAILGVCLAALIYVGYWLNRKGDKPKKRNNK